MGASRLVGQEEHLRTPEDYRKAIAELEASTASIESHIATTQQILDNINLKQQTHRPTSQNKHQALSSQISAQHDAITQYLATTSADLKKAISSTLVTIDDTLSCDDYAFNQITHSVSADRKPTTHHSSLEDIDEDDHDPAESHTSRLLAALIITETSLIRTRLNRIYLETVHSTQGHNARDDDEGSTSYVDPTKTALIQSDLRTLHAEIDDVTSLFVGHEHGETLTQLHDQIARAKQILRAQRSEWAFRQIREMTRRLEEIEGVVRGVQGHRMVMGRLGTLLAEVDARGLESRQGIKVDSAEVKSEDYSGVDGTALVGLRGYLGVGSAGKEHRAEDVFGDVTMTFDRTLNVQDGQKRSLVGAGEPIGEGQAEDLRKEYRIMLDNLDEEIGRVKEGIAKLAV